MEQYNLYIKRFIVEEIMKVKNIRISATTFVLVLIGVILTIYINKPIDKSTQSVVTNENPVSNDQNIQDVRSNENLTFAVLGDVHQDAKNFQEVINDLYTINPRMDTLVLNGDTVDKGIEEQYNNVKKIISDNKELLPKKIIKNIGNHEFYNYNDLEVNSPKQVQVFIKRYLEFSGEEKVYHDTWIKDYHFISLGSEDGNSETLDSLMAFISEDQQKWLKEKLAEKYQNGKPIFVFLHQPLNSGDKYWLEGGQNNQVREILSKYPEVILFTSHTHNDLNSSSVVLDQPFTMIETGAVYYTILPNEYKEGSIRIAPYIKGLYIEVDGNKVIVKGRDFKEKKWIFINEILKK